EPGAQRFVRLPPCLARRAPLIFICTTPTTPATRATAMQVGTEYLIDAAGCPPQALRDADLLRALCGRLLANLDLRVVGEWVWPQFRGPRGLTGLYLLTESHLACHTYPEHGVATFNLYCCRSRPRWGWEEHLRDALGAAAVSVRSLPRGPAGPGGES